MGKKSGDMAQKPKKQWTDKELGKGFTLVLVDDNDGQSAIIGGRLREIFGLQVMRDDTTKGPKKFKEWLGNISANHNIPLICFDRETYWENGHGGRYLHLEAAHQVPMDVADTYKVGRDIVNGMRDYTPGLEDTEIFSISDHNVNHGAKPGNDRLFNRGRAIAELKAGAGETVDYVRRALLRARGVGPARGASNACSAVLAEQGEIIPAWAKELGYKPEDDAFRGEAEPIKGKVRSSGFDRSGD